MNESLKAPVATTLDMIRHSRDTRRHQGALLFVNSRCADYLARPKNHPLRFGTDAPRGTLISPFCIRAITKETRRVWSTSLSTGCAGEVSFRVRDAEGNYRRAEPLIATDGTVQYWIAVNLDIEARKRAEFFLAGGQRLAPTGSWAFSPAGFHH